MKKILLVNLKKKFENVNPGWPHLGLVSLGSVLKNADFEVVVVDYAYTPEAPDLKAFCEQFKPDILGLSIYTSVWDRYDKLIDELPEYFNAVVMIGGPHASLRFEELSKDKRLDYIFTGEAEEKIVDICLNARKQQEPEVVHCRYVDVKSVPLLNFAICHGHEKIKERGFQLSRGCPYQCTFCQIKIIASRKIRYQNIDHCIKDIEESLDVLPELKTVRIVDDCPSLRLDLFKAFIRKFIEKFPQLTLSLMHLRADQVDAEALSLLKKAGLVALTIGIESGNPEVFNFIKKGTKLEKLEKGCQVIKDSGLLLYLAFIIGLPRSTYESEKDSIDFAKRVNPYYIYWNMLIPFRGTEAGDWLEKNGRIYPEKYGATLIDSNLQFDGASAETDDYPLWDRERAQIRAVLETKAFPFRLKLIPRILSLGYEYRLWPSVAYLFFYPRSTVKIVLDVVENDILKPYLLPALKRNKKWPLLRNLLKAGYMKINLVIRS